jgi:ATP-dependent exoDNAse (exonuclease V) beta subunit
MIKTMAASGMQISDRKSGGKRTLRYGDIAIIVSSIKSLPRDFEDALATRQIPYIMSGGFSFYDRSEIEEILAFLKLLAFPDDDHSVAKILTGPLYGLDDSELSDLSNAGRLDGVGLLPHILARNPEELPIRAAHFRDLFIQIKERSSKPGLLDLCHTILEQAGFYEYAASQSSEMKRRRMENNLGKFLGIVRGFEQNGIFTSLRDFLNYIERILMSDIEEDEAGLGLEEGDALKVMTIHKSKGLEFPLVFCPFLKNRTYRAANRIYFDRHYGLLVNDPSQPGRQGASPLLEEHLVHDRIAAEHEDRRKLYVAFTRAEDFLVIIGQEEHRQAAENEKRAEPIGEICEILDKNTETGSIGYLSDWRSLVHDWLQQTGANQEEVKAPPVFQPANLTELAGNIRSITAFLQANHDEKCETNNDQEIYSLQDISLFKSCPRRYFFTSRHVSSFSERIPSFSGIVGTLVHETIRLYHAANGHQNLPGRSNTVMAAEILGSIVPFYGEEGRQAAPIARRIVQNYAVSALGQSEPWMIEAEVNVKFAGGFAPFFVRGFADRVDRENGQTRIIDFKTRNYSAAAHEQYRNQLALYRIAANRGVLAESGCLDFAMSYIAYLSLEEVRLVEIEPDLAGFENEIVATVMAIRNESAWQPRAGELCNDCGYAVLCHGAIGV